MRFFTSAKLDHWGGDDKFAHLGLGGMLWAAEHFYAVDSLLVRALAFLALACLWELLEWVRMDEWTQGTGDFIQQFLQGRKWPFACDFFSWRDVVADCAGALLMQFILTVHP